MGYLSWLADELTEIEERLAESDLADFSGPLRIAINKAFVKACEADRDHRSAMDVGARSKSKLKAKVGDQAFEWRPGGGATGGSIRVNAKVEGGAVAAPIAEPISAEIEKEIRRRAHGPSRAPRAAAAPLR